MNTITYTTKTDAINYAILPALGDFAGEHDAEAIFEATFTYDAEAGGFVQTATTDEFWAAVEAAAL